jgi:hypothetical protein
MITHEKLEDMKTDLQEIYLLVDVIMSEDSVEWVEERLRQHIFVLKAATAKGESNVE